jgi:hypothetical protein
MKLCFILFALCLAANSGHCQFYQNWPSTDPGAHAFAARAPPKFPTFSKAAIQTVTNLIVRYEREVADQVSRWCYLRHIVELKKEAKQSWLEEAEEIWSIDNVILPAYRQLLAALELRKLALESMPPTAPPKPIPPPKSAVPKKASPPPNIPETAANKN